VTVGKVLRAGVAYWLAVFAAGFALGVARTLFVVPHVGPLVAVAIELPIILSIAWWICARILRWAALDRRGAIAMGAVAFLLLMLAELTLSVQLFGRTVTGHLALYADPAHLLGLAGQVAFALFPWLQSDADPARAAPAARANDDRRRR
jgi:hypothetical protein